VLSEGNKKIIKNLLQKIHSQTEVLGAEALARLFECHPQTKSYFPKFSGFSANDKRVKHHGDLVLKALVDTNDHLDDLPHHLHKLAEKHGKDLLVDPHNFKLFSDCIAVTLAAHLQEKSPETHCAVDKFLEEVTYQLSSLYR
uniref:Hemoglobin subunit alpha-2 n=1 Tax=Torpedo marmorata TaxID=7788 RepID=HBA2_TORMA|nr:RecName: Full=Hemoglobin subunit alpha-2; AltName: Full=Alpha-2-globin; AltName: Full=Hemoglobin alpha-2 chain [Torpedo marmorata]